MHLMIPNAFALDEGARLALQSLPLPTLSQLLGLMQPCAQPLGNDEFDGLLPFERALSQARSGPPDAPPLAAWALQDSGLDAGTAVWAQITPLHLSVSADQFTAIDASSLDLTEDEARALFSDLSQLFPTDEGWRQHFGNSLQWFVAHDSLDQIRTASIERVLQRNVQAWLPEARRLRTLQNEIQMLLHTSPTNAAREARGQVPINAVWMHGLGRASGHPLPPELHIDTRLRKPAVHADWAAWCQAWQALDAGPLRELLTQVQEGTGRLTLCGERRAQSFTPRRRGAVRAFWQRLRPPQGKPLNCLSAL